MKTVCILVVLGSYFIVESFCGLVPQPFQCQQGVPYMENECNSCFCLKDNDLVCTIKPCPEEEERRLQNCTLGNVWRNGCNTCWCVNTGTVCTNHTC